MLFRKKEEKKIKYEHCVERETERIKKNRSIYMYKIPKKSVDLSEKINYMHKIPKKNRMSKGTKHKLVWKYATASNLIWWQLEHIEGTVKKNSESNYYPFQI